MDRGLVQVLVNLGTEVAEFDVAEGYTLIAESKDRIAVQDGRIALPSNSLAILSAERS